MKLSQCIKGRDNNFNLIRFIAAFAVLVSHSFALASGIEADPFTPRLGMNLGAMAVDVFFITSGLLVTGSLLSRKNTLEFVWARVLRIFPGIAVMDFLLVFGLGLAFTTLPAAAYLKDHQTHAFALKNLTLITGAEYMLPGVFASVPYKGVVNGSLWTLPLELDMYAILAMMWVGLWVLGSLREKLLPYCIVALAGLAFLIRFYIHFHVHGERHVESTRMIYMFFTGATFYVLKEHITLSRRVFLVALAALLLSAFHREVFYVVYNIVLAYILFWIAYVPGGFIRAFNRLGDYSYGTYIYAFPVTQSFLALMPGVRVPVLILLSAVVTLTLASLSWHLIEKRALSLKASPGKIFRRVTGPNSGRQPVQAQ